MAEMADEVNRTAWHFVAGSWVEGDDPVMDEYARRDFSGPESGVFKALGYELLMKIGDRYSGGFELLQREESPRWVFAVGEDEMTNYVYVTALPDALTFAASWSALTRNEAITGFLDRILSSGRHDLSQSIETIVRRVKEEWNDFS